MLKKDNEIKWTLDARKYFKDIKKPITKAPILVSRDFSKYFMIFSYASKITIVGVLLQKIQQNFQQPIDLFSNVLRDAELKYDIIIDVFVTSECIHLYILYCTPMLLFGESLIFHCTPMFLSGESLI